MSCLRTRRSETTHRKLFSWDFQFLLKKIHENCYGWLPFWTQLIGHLKLFGPAEKDWVAMADNQTFPFEFNTISFLDIFNPDEPIPVGVHSDDYYSDDDFNWLRCWWWLRWRWAMRALVEVEGLFRQHCCLGVLLESKYMDKLVVTCSVQRWKVEILDLINKLAYLQQIFDVVLCNFLNFCVFW